MALRLSLSSSPSLRSLHTNSPPSVGPNRKVDWPNRGRTCGSVSREASRTVAVRSSLEIAAPAVGSVTEVNKDTFWPIVETAGEKVVVLDMYTQWCGPCKVMAPRFQELSEKYLDVVFLKLDCNQENKSLAKELGIKVVPTFKILKDRKVVKEVTGAKFDDLVLAIETAKSN
ncbi:thioredoxin F-type, chloroplastic-like [Typha latifolia]|uniref:thioredoxin F-type, chloroplastic-like n=1 Tax=Typha latifolia TaxID=4733 RepID=UPI003C2BB370